MTPEDCPRHPGQKTQWPCELCKMPLCTQCSPARWEGAVYCPDCLKKAEAKAEADAGSAARRRVWRGRARVAGIVLAVAGGFAALNRGCDAVNAFFLRRQYEADPQPAPDFTATDAEGNQIKLSALRGKVVVLDFWASWCSPCIRLIPDLKTLHSDYKDSAVALIGINLDPDVETMAWAVKEHGIEWPQILDAATGSPDLSDRYGVYGIPATVIIDKKGRIFKRWTIWDRKMSYYVDFLLKQPGLDSGAGSDFPEP